MIDASHKWNTSYKPLIIGLLFSIILTLAAYYIVVESLLSGLSLMVTILGLGVIQALVQLVFFLHLGQESKPHWYLMTFLFMVLILVVVIGGSLWIMYNLNYNMMPTMEH